MIGYNELHFNHATMQQLIQDYLQRTCVDFTGVVQDVKYDAIGGWFIIATLHKEEPQTHEH